MLSRLAKLIPQPPKAAKQQLLPAIWHHLNPQLQTLKLHELSLTLWAAAKLGYSQPQLYDACLGLFLQQLDKAPPRHLSNVIYAIATAPQDAAAQHAQQVLQQLLPAFVQLVEAGEANPQVCCNTVTKLSYVTCHVTYVNALDQKCAGALAAAVVANVC
jgi:glutamine synthetase adenylyltransferase